ncbi:MAG: hypothetical protein QXP46_06860, partial [Archaeoglobaceae archaeon]
MDSENTRKEKLKRIEDVINGKEPDRVPVTGATAVWHGAYAGYTTHEVLFDYSKCKSAWLKVARDFDFDTFT